jgi:hypothetical protein
VIHAHKMKVTHGQSEQTIRPKVMDALCSAIKSKGTPTGHVFFHIYTKTTPTNAEISYIKLFGYFLEYHECISDWQISWGGDK